MICTAAVKSLDKCIFEIKYQQNPAINLRISIVCCNAVGKFWNNFCKFIFEIDNWNTYLNVTL